CRCACSAAAVSLVATPSAGGGRTSDFSSGDCASTARENRTRKSTSKVFRPISKRHLQNASLLAFHLNKCLFVFIGQGVHSGLRVLCKFNAQERFLPMLQMHSHLFRIINSSSKSAICG